MQRVSQLERRVAHAYDESALPGVLSGRPRLHIVRYVLDAGDLRLPRFGDAHGKDDDPAVILAVCGLEREAIVVAAGGHPPPARPGGHTGGRPPAPPPPP